MPCEPRSFWQPCPKTTLCERQEVGRGNFTWNWRVAAIAGRWLAAWSKNLHLRCCKEQGSPTRVFSCHWWEEIKWRLFGLNCPALWSWTYVINHPWKVLLTAILTRLNKPLLCTVRCNFILVEEFTNDLIDKLLFLTVAHFKSRPRMLIFHWGVIWAEEKARLALNFFQTWLWLLDCATIRSL